MQKGDIQPFRGLRAGTIYLRRGCPYIIIHVQLRTHLRVVISQGQAVQTRTVPGKARYLVTLALKIVQGVPIWKIKVLHFRQSEQREGLQNTLQVSGYARHQVQLM